MIDGELAALSPIIKATARKAAPYDHQLAADLEQDAWVDALEAAKNHRGENGAELATYCYRAIKLAVWRGKTLAGCPVSVPRHAVKHAWDFRKKALSWDEDGPADELDLLPGASTNGEAEVDQTQMTALVQKHIQDCRHPEAVEEILLRDGCLSDVAAEHGIGADTLSRTCKRVSAAIRRDKALAGLYHGRLVRASDAAREIGLELADMRELTRGGLIRFDHQDSVLMIDRFDLMKFFASDAAACAALAKL